MTTHEITINPKTDIPQASPARVMVLAFIGGAGLILMMLALGIGVVQGDAANGSVMGITFVGGLILLALGIGGWIALVQPFKNFDDINVPQYTGHHDHEEHEKLEASAEAQTSIIPHE